MDEGSRLELVLADIRTAFAEHGTKLPDMFGDDQVIISSAKLIKALIAIEGHHPWAEMGKAEKPLTANKLAHMLKPLGIAPGNVGPKDNRRKGYGRDQFEEAFSRYLPPEGVSNRTPVHQPVNTGTSDDSKPYTEEDRCTVAECKKPNNDGTVYGCTVGKEESSASTPAQPSAASAGQQESARGEGPSSDAKPEKNFLSRVNSNPHIRTPNHGDGMPPYTGPVVDVPDQGSDPLDRHGTPRAAKPAPPLTSGHARDLRARSLDWIANREAANLDVTTAGLEAELRTILREEVALGDVEAAIAQVMELVFAV